jgi:hypothetical protein
LIYKDVDDIFANEGLPFNVLLELESLGVLTGLDAIGGVAHNVNFEPDPEDTDMSIAVISISPHSGILIRHKTPQPAIKMPIYKVLQAGKELISLGQFDIHHGYLMKFVDFFKNKECETHFVNLIPTTPGRAQVINRRPIEFAT